MVGAIARFRFVRRLAWGFWSQCSAAVSASRRVLAAALPGAFCICRLVCVLLCLGRVPCQSVVNAGKAAACFGCNVCLVFLCDGLVAMRWQD